MRIRWTPAAAGDLQHIADYLKEHYPQYRQATLRKLYDTVRSLREWPARGRPARNRAHERFSSRHCLLPSPIPRLRNYPIPNGLYWIFTVKEVVPVWLGLSAPVNVH